MFKSQVLGTWTRTKQVCTYAGGSSHGLKLVVGLVDSSSIPGFHLYLDHKIIVHHSPTTKKKATHSYEMLRSVRSGVILQVMGYMGFLDPKSISTIISPCLMVEAPFGQHSGHEDCVSPGERRESGLNGGVP